MASNLFYTFKSQILDIMKYLSLIFSAVLFTALFTNCAGNKSLQQKAPAKIGNAYVQNTQEGFELFIPIKTLQEQNLNLNKVYYRGRIAALKVHPQHSGIYYAQFEIGNNNMIMSSDPKEEYGNKAPVKMEKIPFKLNKDEAVIEFTKDGKIEYYKIENITERS